jgi:hypothetical protein
LLPSVWLTTFSLPAPPPSLRNEQELRKRFLATENEKKEAATARGLAVVEERFEGGGLRKHDVYAPTFAPETLLLPPPQASDADAGAADAQSSSGVVREPVPGVFLFPFLSPAFCAQVFDELQHYEATARARPELGLPLQIRHDGNFGSLQNAGFAPLLRAIEAVIAPLVAKYMPEKEGGVEVYHAFLTRNWVGRPENATFKTHCDKSDLTFNLCLVGRWVDFFLMG